MRLDGCPAMPGGSEQRRCLLTCLPRGLACCASYPRLNPGHSSYLGKGPPANRALVPCGAARLSANLDDAPPEFYGGSNAHRHSCPAGERSRLLPGPSRGLLADRLGATADGSQMTYRPVHQHELAAGPAEHRRARHSPGATSTHRVTWMTHIQVSQPRKDNCSTPSPAVYAGPDRSVLRDRDGFTVDQ